MYVSPPSHMWIECAYLKRKFQLTELETEDPKARAHLIKKLRIDFFLLSHILLSEIAHVVWHLHWNENLIEFPFFPLISLKFPIVWDWRQCQSQRRQSVYWVIQINWFQFKKFMKLNFSLPSSFNSISTFILFSIHCSNPMAPDEPLIM